MLLLIDIGNTHTHLGLANDRRVVRRLQLTTAGWARPAHSKTLRQWLDATPLSGAALCSVVPQATRLVKRVLRACAPVAVFELNARTVSGVGIRYPRPESIGPDRLANAVAVRHHYGAPAVAVDFGTALTFDVIDRHGHYVGGIIAPGLAALTDYLHQHTALLPRIRIRDTAAVIGRSTTQAMRIGAVHGYRGLVRHLIRELKGALGCRRLPVVATGGYARLMARGLPEFTGVEPGLTLEGLRLEWRAARTRKPRRR
ncbi:MAG: type III pantothenate kinase [Verrucomicrobia bacterium]|nr:type III pantothenate kinase [Verrucomicrobiota bacterium]